MSLALSAGHLGQGQGYRGELQGPDGCSGNAGGLQLLASHPASLGRLPEGRIGWLAPMLSQSILLSRWMKCGSGGGSCSQFSLAFATPSSPIYRGHPSSCQCMEARPRAGVYYLWPDPEVTSPYLRPPRGIFSVEWGALPPSLELLNAIPTCGLCHGTCQVPAA